jgi:hypothetical protein
MTRTDDEKRRYLWIALVLLVITGVVFWWVDW